MSKYVVMSMDDSYDNINLIDTINEQEQEINKLNNIINELEKILEYEKNDYNGDIDIETRNIDSEFLRGNAWEADYILDKLKKLKGEDKE